MWRLKVVVKRNITLRDSYEVRGADKTAKLVGSGKGEPLFEDELRSNLSFL